MASGLPTYTFTFRFVGPGETLALGIALPLICVLIVALRFWVRRVQQVLIGIDDWLSLGGLVMIIGMGVCLIYGVHTKVMGYPTPDPPTNLTEDQLLLYVDPTTELVEKLEFPYQILMILAYGLIKLSIIFFYRRLFVVNRGTMFEIASKAMTVVMLLWTIAFVLIIIFPCGTAFWANWGSTEAQLEHCSIAFTSEYGLAISDLVLDTIVILMPIPVIWKLRLTLQRKWAVTGVILLGASAIGASIARLVLYIQTLHALTANIVVDGNQSITVSLYWSLLEAGLALIAACLPILSYLVTHFNARSVILSVRSVFSPVLTHITQRSDAGSQDHHDNRKRSSFSMELKDATSSVSHSRLSREGDGREEYTISDLELGKPSLTAAW